MCVAPLFTNMCMLHPIFIQVFHACRLVTGSLDETVRTWDVRSGKCVRTLVGHTGVVMSVSLDRNLVVSGGSDGQVRVWSRRDGVCRHVLHGHTNTLHTVLLVSHRDIVVSADFNSTVRVWHGLTGALVQAPIMNTRGTYRGLPENFSFTASPLITIDNRLVTAASHPTGSSKTPRTVDVRALRTGQLLHSMANDPTSVDIRRMVLVPDLDNNFVVTGDDRGIVRVWDVEKGVWSGGFAHTHIVQASTCTHVTRSCTWRVVCVT
jgi:WD40 repeat protein